MSNVPTKVCSYCKMELPISAFYNCKRGKYGKQGHCKVCFRKYQREYEKRPGVKEKKRKVALERYHRIKRELFDILGRSCAVCGFDDLRALQIDHVHGGGRKHIRSYGSASHYYSELLKELKANPELIKNYQTLCANHNWIKRYENREVN